MTQAFRYLSPTSGYNPVATDYVIGYIRDKAEFPINRYVQLVQAPAPSFFYYTLDRDQAIRVRSQNQWVFADGAKRLVDEGNQFPYRETQAFCVRYNISTMLGDMALKYASKAWNAKQVYLKSIASQMMTLRTLNVVTLLDTASNWPSTNTADAATLAGGGSTWDRASDDPADANYNIIKKALTNAQVVIVQQTRGKVQPKDLKLVVSPNLARAMGNSAEMHNYIRQTDRGWRTVEGEPENVNGRFGLPSHVYGFEVVVEESMILQDLPTAGATAASTATTFIKADPKAVIVSRPGGVEAPFGPSFSTAQLYWADHQMTAYEFADPHNLRTEMHLTDQHVAVLPAPEAGFLITGCL